MKKAMPKVICAGMLLPLAAAWATAAPPEGAHLSNEPYRLSRPAASNRSGSAVLFARALMSRDGETRLQASIAPFEMQAPAVGSISRVQVKTYGPSGSVSTDNYKDTFGPTFEHTQPGLYYGQRVQFQANVVGVDANRTDVVTIETFARRAPDLTVTSLTVPSTARPGLPVVVRAAVRELNGDSGARGDCVLRSEGVEVDRAPRIWVDAGGNVECMLQATFDTAGTRSLQVEVAAVDPADWDTANNVATGTVVVEAPAHSYHPAGAGVLSFTETTSSFERMAWTSYDPAEGVEMERRESSEGWNQQEFFWGYPAVRLEFPISHFSLTIDRDGVPRTWRYDNIPLSWGGGGPDTFSGCAMLQDAATDADRVAWLQICTGWGPTWVYASTVYSRSSSDILYMATSYGRHWSGTPDNTTSYWFWNDTRQDRSGEYVAPGSRYMFMGELVSTGQLYRSAVDLTVELVNDSSRFPPDGPACHVNEGTWGRSEWCHEMTFTRTGAAGFGRTSE